MMGVKGCITASIQFTESNILYFAGKPFLSILLFVPSSFLLPRTHLSSFQTTRIPQTCRQSQKPPRFSKDKRVPLGRTHFHLPNPTSRMLKSDSSSSDTEHTPQSSTSTSKRNASAASSTPAAARSIKSLPARVPAPATAPQTQKTRPAKVNGAPATPSQQNGASAIKPTTSGSSKPNKPPLTGTSAQNDSVGLSNAQLSHGRRQMLDLVNRLHSTG